MFIGDLEVEIQIIFLKLWKNHLVQFSPLVYTLKGCHDECTMGKNTRDWTNSFFNSRQCLVSQLLYRSPMNIK